MSRSARLQKPACTSRRRGALANTETHGDIAQYDSLFLCRLINWRNNFDNNSSAWQRRLSASARAELVMTSTPALQNWKRWTAKIDSSVGRLHLLAPPCVSTNLLLIYYFYPKWINKNGFELIFSLTYATFASLLKEQQHTCKQIVSSNFVLNINGKKPSSKIWIQTYRRVSLLPTFVARPIKCAFRKTLRTAPHL